MALDVSQSGRHFADMEDLKGLGFPWRVFVFSAFLFAFALFIFLGLKVGYGSFLNAQASGLDADIEELAGRVDSEGQSNLISFYSRLANIEGVLKEHRFAANALDFLERSTLPGVYYSAAVFSDEELSLTLDGAARSVADVVGQFSVFDAAPEVKESALGGVSFDNFEIRFGATVVFKEGFFEKPE